MRDPRKMTGAEISKEIYYHRQRIHAHEAAIEELCNELRERQFRRDFDNVQKYADILINKINELEFVRAFSGVESDDSYIIKIEKIRRKDYEQED